jgi:hypothetical protein
MRKAGGEQEEFTAPATSDGKGGCKYSLKVPGGPGTWSLGVADLFLSPTSDSLGPSNNKHKGDLQYIKWEQQYQQKQDKTNLFLKTYSSEWTWIKGGANDLAIKGESKELKIDGLSAQASLPLYVSWGGGVGG